jgi:glycosyltransferase involved in cell wall biosynthesis
MGKETDNFVSLNCVQTTPQIKQGNIKCEVKSMETTPLVSIITPSFNQGQFIEETILSIRNQSYKNIEHIVIDGGSTDHTLEILNKYSSSVSWISGPDKGQTDAINKGIKRSHGEILAYLNSDDLYLPETIKTIVDFFSEHPEIDMLYGDIIHIDKHSQYIETIKTGTINFEKYLTGLVYLPQPTVFFRRKIIGKTGYFDEKLHLAMDLDYWIRVFFIFQTAYLPVTLAKARIYPEAKSSANVKSYFDERLYILKKTFSDEKKIVSYFGSVDKAKKINNKSCGYVYFFEGLEYQDRKQLPVAISYIIKGVWLYPRYLLSPFLYWFFFIVIFGKGIAKKIGPHLRKPDRHATYEDL